MIKIDVLDRQFFNVSPHSSTVERFLDMEEAAGATPAVGTIFVDRAKGMSYTDLVLKYCAPESSVRYMIKSLYPTDIGT